jgi:HEAT repeat protein
MARNRAPKLDKLRRKGDVDGLARALSYTSTRTEADGRMVDDGIEVRLEAAAALADQDDPRAHDALVRALSDPEEEVRVAAIRGLRQRGDPAAVEPLMIVVQSWLGPERERSREEALDGLAEMADPEMLRRTAADLAGRSMDYAAADAAIVSRLAVAAERDGIRASVDELVDDLREPATALRARTLLAWMGAESVEPLIGVLGDELARGPAALVLGSIRDSRAVEPLASLLRTCDDAEARKAAAWALGEIRDPAAVEALLAATADEDYAVRAEAGASFDKLGNAGVAIALGTLVQPALESAASAAAPGLEAGAADGGQTADGSSEPADAVRPGGAVEPPVTPAPQPAPPAPGVRPRGERAAPMLRRLLGLDGPGER